MTKYLYGALASILILLSAVFFSYNWGYDNATYKAEASQKTATEEALYEFKIASEASIRAVTTYYESERRLEAANVKMEEEVRIFVSKSGSDINCLDSDGVQYFNSLGKSAKSKDIYNPTYAMPSESSGLKRREEIGYFKKPSRFSIAVQEMSR